MTQYIITLPQDTQKAIISVLKAIGIEDIGEAISGRLCDLQDTIDITPFL